MDIRLNMRRKQKKGDETYLITFTERLEKGEDKGSWFVSYEVDRWSSTAKGSKMTPPPYAN